MNDPRKNPEHRGPAGKKKGQKAQWIPVTPLDYQILQVLPKEGALVFGSLPDGRSSKQISEQRFGGQIRTMQVGPRMGLMNNDGVVASVHGLGTMGAKLYQITPKGEQILTEWEAKHPDMVWRPKGGDTNG
jgi:hypothetical protein